MMTDQEFRSLCGYIMGVKSIKMRALCSELNIPYTYFSKMINGKVPTSHKYVEVILRYCQENSIDVDAGKSFGQATRQEKVSEPAANYDTKPINGPAMYPGASLEITTKLVIKNDIVTSYNVDMKRLS